MAREASWAEDQEDEAQDDSEQEEDSEQQQEERGAAYAPRSRQDRRSTAGQYQRRGGSSRRFRPRRKVCSFCVDKVKEIEYKDSDTLRRYLDGHGKIIPRRKTGTCAKHQRRLTLAIKRARHLALLPFAARRTPYS